MGILDFNLKDNVQSLRTVQKDPFNRAPIVEVDLKGAHERHDFKNGFQIIEIQDGIELENEQVILRGSDMPMIPFTFGGAQKIVKDYYPGNSEPSVQVLGPRENNIVIKGRLKAKTINISASQDKETYRNYPQEMQQLIEAMRIRGNLVRMSMGEFQRFGFIENVVFNMRTLADIDYEIDFSIVGFNAPRNCKIIAVTKQVPFDINKDLINEVQAFQASAVERLPTLEDLTANEVPEFTLDKSISTQINDLTSDVAEKIKLVTDYVDSILTEVDEVRLSIDRAEGLIKNARITLTRYINRIGSFDIFGERVLEDPNGISPAYKNAAYLSTSISETNSLSAFLERLREQLNNTFATAPVARHRIITGDNLQKLSVRYYQDVAYWQDIFDHNNLETTDLSTLVGEILEIPEVT